MAVPVQKLEGSHFTPREIEILRLVATGMGNKEIAGKLGLSRRTVGTHLERLFARNGFHSRAEALAYWLKAGVGQTSDLT